MCISPHLTQRLGGMYSSVGEMLLLEFLCDVKGAVKEMMNVSLVTDTKFDSRYKILANYDIGI